MVQLSNTTTILIVSKNSSFIETTRESLSKEQDLTLFDKELNSGNLNRVFAETNPDVILLDFTSLYQPYFMAHRITSDFPRCELVAILAETQSKYSDRMFQLGARAVIQYPDQSDKLPEIIRNLINPIEKTESVTTQAPFLNDPPTNQRTFTVFSPKGGAGCTTVAINLAISLHKLLKEDVLIVDGKHMFGHVKLFLNMLTGNSITDLMAHANMLDQQLIEQVVLKHRSGIHVLPGPNIVKDTEEIRPESLFLILKTLKKLFPNIIIDGGSYLNENTITYFDISEKIILILNPDLASIHDMRQFMDVTTNLSYDEDKLLFILNLAERKINMSKDEIDKILNIKIAGKIPDDDNFALICLNEGVPMLLKKPHHPISKAYTDITRALIKNPQPAMIN